MTSSATSRPAAGAGGDNGVQFQLQCLQGKVEDLEAANASKSDRIVQLEDKLLARNVEVDLLKRRVADLEEEQTTLAEAKMAVARSGKAADTLEGAMSSDEAAISLPATSFAQHSSKPPPDEHSIENGFDQSINALAQSYYDTSKEKSAKGRSAPVDEAGAASASAPGSSSQRPEQLQRGLDRNHRQRWLARFRQLIAYRLEHGDCNVPKTYQQDPSLHAWVRSQRVHRRQFDEGKPSDGMCQARIDALDKISFEWFVGHRPKEDQWHVMFQSLIAYKNANGDTNVKIGEDKKLYKWVLNQRARKRLLERVGEGKCKGMTWARAAKLDAIDFNWDGKSHR